MEYNVLKDRIIIFNGSQSLTQLLVALMTELKPQHKWTIEVAADPHISDNAFAPLYWDNSVIRCDLKDNWLVLTVPDISAAEFKDFRHSIKELGFKWRRHLRLWAADYTHERATDNFRDDLIETLSKFIKPQTKPHPFEQVT